MPHTYHLVRVSANVKTGPIPVSTSSSSTCPPACPLKGSGCYAEYGPLGIHWRAVSHKGRGYSLEQLCTEIKRLPKRQLWRYAQAGDLPGHDNRIDHDALEQIVQANTGKNGFAYTHYPAHDPHNAQVITHAIAEGFTINLSADNLEHADALADLGIAPVATVLPPEQTQHTHTPAGRAVIICPSVTNDAMDCARCGVCAVPQRKAIIGFPAHGTGKKRAAEVFRRSKR